MRSLKRVGAVLSVLFVIVVPVVLLLTSVQLVAFDRNYYRKEYLKYSISQHIGMNDEELMASTEKLLEYIEDKRDNLDFKADFKGKQEEFFSQRDKLHMIDVKMLFVNGRYIRNFSVLFIAVFLVLLYKIRSKEYFGSSLAKHGLFVFIAGTIPVIVLVILMNHDFYKYFTIFHEIFLTMIYGYWIPTWTDLLIYFHRNSYRHGFQNSIHLYCSNDHSTHSKFSST